MILDRLYSKRELAFYWCFEDIWNSAPRCYFWTFTPHCLMSDRQFAQAWNRYLTRWNGWGMGEGFKGLRVFEPFQSGRLHCHALINERFAVQAMRRVSAGTGIGRIHVRRAKPSDAHYLAKYMHKSQWKLPDGCRMWAKFGGWSHIPANRIEVQSDLATLTRAAFRTRYSHIQNNWKRICMARQWARQREIDEICAGSYDVVTQVPEIGGNSYNVVTAGRVGAGQAIFNVRKDSGAFAGALSNFNTGK
ncbi:MAG: hypothetical protein HZA93_15010 [Verrucomicrobia bacterium]|nr:hypothetical protein [Verrucomicrobiota bacterium]